MSPLAWGFHSKTLCEWGKMSQSLAPEPGDECENDQTRSQPVVEESSATEHRLAREKADAGTDCSCQQNKTDQSQERSTGATVGVFVFVFREFPCWL